MVHPPASLESHTRTASLRSWLTVGAALLMTLAMTSIATAWTPTTPPVGVAAWGSTGSDIATSVVQDASGNLFVVGYFSGTIDFDPGAGVTSLTSAGSDDAYVMKLDVGGGLQWAIAIGGSTADRAHSVTLAPSGDIVIAGSYSGTFDADPGVGVSTLTSAGSDDVFLMKLDEVTGTLVWVRSLGGTYSDVAMAVTTDASGNVYSTGSFMNNIDLDPGSGTLMRYAVGTAQTEVFISKLDANGDYSWGGSVGGSSNERGLAIAVDVGHMYITGYYDQPADFNPDPSVSNTMTNNGNPDDVFVLKLTNAGAYVWSRRVGAGNGTARGTGITVDTSGNVYTTGHFSGTSADFDPAVSDLLISSAGSSDVFVWKLDSSGLLAWAKTIGSTGTAVGTEIQRDSS
ncbi:MAG: SBBP repeat-containing protein [Ilumatobacteraceae bacterium]